jgi:hypothetical protein
MGFFPLRTSQSGAAHLRISYGSLLRVRALSIVSDCDTNAAPGLDGVGAGIWKISVQRSAATRAIVLALLNMCVRLSMIPDSGRSSVIVPLLKKVREEPAMKNIRPISLQSALTKILMKGLASRLSSILVQFKILHPAQEAFMVGGAPFKCIDTLLDIWETAKQENRSCFNIFYDIAGAYDSVPHVAIIRALRRLSIPESFVALIADSLSGLQSCVRTPYGNTGFFNVSRSVRQGDPLAPLLYIIFMDPLHQGLDFNPL